MFLPQANEKNLQLFVQIEKDVPHQLIGDANRITQILVNLINNAVKFTHEGEVRIHVSVTDKKENQTFLRISVIDTGEGIAYDQREAIFDRFYQSNARTGSGTGLGLPIVKRITEVLGGYVVLESTIGKGSAFHVHLPFETPLQTKVRISDLPLTLDVSKRILIAEDNQFIRQLIGQIFELYHIPYDAVVSGNELIKKIEQQTDNNPYVLILTDLQLPDIEGSELAKQLRLEKKLGIPIIGMSASALESEKEKCLEAGMNGYIAKPFNSAKLLDVIGAFVHIPIVNELLLPKPPYTDLNYIIQLANGDKAFIRKMVELFIMENKLELDKLEIARQTGNITDAKQIMHHMRSTIAFFGLESKLDPLFRSFEQDASQASLNQLVQQITHICKQAILELEQSNS
jgi:CheY-like chemotaxis protein